MTSANKIQPKNNPRTGWGRLFRLHPDTLETLRAHPDDYSPMTSSSRLKSLRYAVAGWLYMLRYQKNTRIQAVFSVLVILAGLWVSLTPVEWAIIVLTITINWLAEFLNAAVEAAVNLASSEIHPMARVGKDVGAAAVLMTSVAAIMIAVLIIVPPFLAKFLPLLATLSK
jgi:diacylglycerol kinase (ATP)